MTPCPKCADVPSTRCVLCNGAGEVGVDRADRYERCARVIAHLRRSGAATDPACPETLGLARHQWVQLWHGVLPEPDLHRVEDEMGVRQ